MERHKRNMGRKIAGLAGLLALAACAQTPDLGRAGPSLIERVDAAFVSGPVDGTVLPLTAAETEIRRISANLLTQRPRPEDDGFFGLTRWTATKSSSVSPSLAYYERLRERMPASGEALINAIIADVDADTAQMERFGGVSQDVVDADVERARNLQPVEANSATVGYDGPGAFAGVRARIAENGRIMDEIGDTLAARLVAYRTALGHARADAPVAERLAVLEDAIHRMDEELALMDRNALAHRVVANEIKGGSAS